MMKQTLSGKMLTIAIAMGVAVSINSNAETSNRAAYTVSQEEIPPAAIQSSTQLAEDYAALQVYLNQGMWAEFIQVNRTDGSAGLAQLAHQLSDSSPEALMGIHYLAYAYLQSAQDEKVGELFESLLTAELTGEQRQRVNEVLATLPARSALEQHDWYQAAHLESPSNLKSDSAIPAGLQASIIFTKVIGAARDKDLGLAKQSMRELNQIYQQTKRTHSRQTKAEISMQLLAAQAWVQQAQGHEGAARQLMEKAVQKEYEVLKLSRLAKLPAPRQLVPMQELFGDLLLEQSRLTEAQAAYAQALGQSRNRYNSLYGMALTAENLGNMEMAEEYYLRLLSITTSKSSQRASLLHAKQFISQHTRDAVTRS